MEKLKSRKAEVGEQLDRSRPRRPRRSSRRAAAVPATPPSGPSASRSSKAVAPREPAGPAERKAPGMADAPKKPGSESYTNRLLKAKQKVWEDREKDKKDKSHL